jgi:hypothetical protein
MISYHLEKPLPERKQGYAKGFKVADIDDLERLGRGISQYVWSPCVWKDGRRLQDNFIGADWAALDFDSGEMTLAEAQSRFCDMMHIIGTTKSHQIGKGGHSPCDRFRVLLRFDKRITDLRVYRWAMHRLLDAYPEADSACKDGARFFYPCKDIVQIETDGFREEVDFKVPDWFGQPPAYQMLREAGIIPTWTRQLLTGLIPEGQRNVTIYRMAKDLTFVGFSEDAIMGLILNCPTYKGQAVSSLLHKKIVEAVRGGSRKAQVEMSGWKEKADD